jgi:penicillin amidase
MNVARSARFFVIGLVAVLVVAALGLYTVLARSYPSVNGEQRLIGLRAQAEIVRDADGVPHVYAQNEHDLFFLQGYVHAQDRLFQLELLRRVGQGRLSELFGAATLDADRLLRTLGLYRVAQREALLLQAETRAALEAYAEGVNKYAENHRESPPLEFLILGVRWEPWRPADSVVIGKIMAWDLGGNMESELLRAGIVARLGTEAAETLFPGAPASTPPILGAGEGPLRIAGLERLGALLATGDRSSFGSNSWVLAGSRTSTGKPLLANDTHLPVRNPSIWYLNHLFGGRFDVVGFSIPGAPGVVIGHNARIAWGVTNANPDVQDLFVERLDPADPRRIRFKESHDAVVVVRERIEVRGAEPVELDVMVTRHGPVLTPVLEGTKELVALRWTALEPGRLLDSVYGIGRASDWTGFREALRDWDVPAQNFVYADLDGHIGYQLAGRIPIRAKGNGHAPVPGWDGEHEWLGFVPFEQLPVRFDPPEGIVVTANQRILSNASFFITDEFDPGFRAQRLTALLRASQRWSASELARVQTDVVDVAAPDMLSFLGSLDPLSDRSASAQTRLRGWDGAMRADSVPAAIYQAWFRCFLERTVRGKLGDPLYREYLDLGRNAAAALHALARTPDHPWFIDLGDPTRSGRDAIAALALEDAVQELERTLGPDQASWSWGRLHTITFEHPLGAVRPLDLVFNIGPHPSAGDHFTVAQAGYDLRAEKDGHRSYAQVVHPSMRLVVDLADLDRSLAVYATGQSGQPFARHWGDMTKSWLAGELLALRYSRQRLGTLEGHLILRPR